MTEISTLLQAKPMLSQLNATLLVNGVLSKKYVKPEPDLIHSLFEQIKTLLDHVRNVRESIEYFNKVETGGRTAMTKTIYNRRYQTKKKLKKFEEYLRREEDSIQAALNNSKEREPKEREPKELVQSLSDKYQDDV